MAAAVISCGGSREPATPLETYKTYILAAKAKDITAMKLLVTAETMRSYERRAKEMGLTVDDIATRDSLFNDNQQTIKTRNEVIEGDAATIEVQNAFGKWEVVPFLREEGVWKIDLLGYADLLIKEIEKEAEELDREIENQRIEPDAAQTPTPAAGPAAIATPDAASPDRLDGAPGGIEPIID